MKFSPEDYMEPQCPLERPCSCGHHHHHAHAHQERIPLQDVIAECDRLFNSEKTAELGEHLRKWRAEAQRIGDMQGELSMLSELMGHYRMADDKERGIPAIRDVFALLDKLGIGGTVSAGTILLNGATALKAFGETEEALTHYAEAFRCYGAHLAPDDLRFAGLLNNMAAAYADNGEIRHAEAYYNKALDVLKIHKNLMDAAVTHINLAQLYHRSDPADPRIGEALDRAMACFDDPDVTYDGYYAHTCRKCASAFGFFGRPGDEDELNSRADALYAGD